MTREDEVVAKSVAHQLILQWKSENILLGMGPNREYMQKCISDKLTAVMTSIRDEQRALIEQQAKKMARLREALEFVAGEASFLSEAEAVAKQALKEEHP